MLAGLWLLWEQVLGVDDDDSDTTASERHWLMAPVGCCLLLMAGSVAAVLRASRLIRSEQAESTRWPLPNCRWLTARWAVRITAWGALVAGIVGLLYAARHFVRHWRVEKEVPTALLLLMILSYSLMLLALLLAAVGLRWREMQEIRRAFRQATKSLFLAGLAAGLAAEVLCDARESHLPDPSWKRSCSMLGASCGLLLLGLVAAQADGQVEREIADQELFEREQKHLARRRQKDDQLREDRLLDSEQGETMRMDSLASSFNFFSRQESWFRSSLGAQSPAPQLKWSLPGFFDRESLDETREPLLGLSSPDSGTPQRLDSDETESPKHSFEPSCHPSVDDPHGGKPASSSRSPQLATAAALRQVRPEPGFSVQASISANNSSEESGSRTAKMGSRGRPDWNRQPWPAGDTRLMPGTSMQPVLAA